MASRSQQSELAERLLGFSAEAFDAGEYESAYHLLMAALHLADHAEDCAVARRIAQLADRQGEAIEAISPPHHLSQRWADRRGTSSVYRTLRVHAHSVLLRIQSRTTLDREFPAWPGG
ncbi:MAG TPA: hypothetical protein VFS33_08805 [Gemmatimonadales bacterium]|nr:hypothetical protein [Gemmatimonadales bacterium]